VLGCRRITLALLRLAEVLAVPPVITSDLSLLVAGEVAAAVPAAWSDVASCGLEVPGEPPSVVAVRDQETATSPAPGPASPRPVYQLPEGRRVGAWWIEPVPSETEGWLAVPGAGPGSPWRLLASSSVEEIPEADSVAVLGAAERPVVRVPSWISADLRAGSPSASLIGRLAVEAERLGTVPWIPGVDPDALVVLLRSGVPLWVDGPAVPA
jgi:hypothetical protein